MNIELKADERIDDLEIKNMKIKKFNLLFLIFLKWNMIIDSLSYWFSGLRTAS